MGYRTPPGGLWAGDYLVVDLDDFNGISMHTKTEPGAFNKCHVRITRAVKFTKHGTYFPLFAKSVEHNETIEGIDMAMLQIKRERKRRKRQNLKPLDPKVSQTYSDIA